MRAVNCVAVMNKSVVFGICVGIFLISIGSRFTPSPKCKDGTPSRSIGKRGACSHHGGVAGGTIWDFILLAVGCAGGYASHSLSTIIIKKRKVGKKITEPLTINEKLEVGFMFSDSEYEKKFGFKYEDRLKEKGVKYVHDNKTDVK